LIVFLVMDYPFKVRQEIFDTYWKFAGLRQDIFFARLHGDPPPWVDDPILNEYKFTNAYRASDRVSQYLIRNVIYKGDPNPEEVIFRTILFKIFNKIETWEFLEEAIGEIKLSTFDFEVYDKLLAKRQASGQPIYTSAYMSCATKAFGFDKKHQNHLALIQKMFFVDNLQKKILDANGLEEVFNLLAQYPLIGGFMAYQLAIDINYSEAINFSENDFTVAGPGAQRGIKKCIVDLQGNSYADVILWMVNNQKKEFERLGIEFKSLFGRPLSAIDCQNLFCEVDKYTRVAFPDIKSNRVRIKHKFKATPKKIQYFYPPKWGLNDKIK